MPFSGQFYYQDAGAGRPVLLVHGWCMSSAVWALQCEEIATEHRFLALDLRGHGKSALPATGVEGFSGYGQDIVCLVEALDLNDLVVVGWSMGAQALLKCYPRLKNRIAGLVLVGATPRFSAAAHFPYGLPPKEAEGMRLKVRRNLTRALDGFYRNLFVEHELDDPVVAKQVAELLSHVLMPSAVSAVEGLEALMEEEVLEEVALVDCPTLLVHGELDRVCLPDASLWLEKSIPGSRRCSFAGCGHAPFLSRPGQFNHALLTFIGALHGTH